MKKKKVFIIIILSIIVSIIFMNTSNAALQSNNGTKKEYNISDWLKNIRNMEASGGTFGLNAEIDENSLLDKGASNGLDVHMEKNTEYGALAILSASSYGNPEAVSGSGTTTTGNSTGVVMENRELVAATTAVSFRAFETVTNADDRYKNLYIKDSSGNYIFLRGDAMKETEKWHNSAGLEIMDSSDNPIYRFYDAKMFSMRQAYWASGSSYVGTWDHPFCSRAVVVIGDGI